MTYQETCQYLFNQMPMFERQGSAGYKEGLTNTLLLDEHLGHPHQSYATIHIGGTNGKGSCSHTLAAILQECGYKVGLYTSPHLVDFRERIRVNGKPVSERYVVDFVERERAFFEPLHPSFFEVTTAMAFQYFKDKEVDIAVIEVGLGGRLDCTNIITPILSIITNISFDHTQFLGDTLSKIAAEKAGIIKRGVPVVIGEANEETRPVFEAKAKEMDAPIIFAEDYNEVISAESLPGGGMLYHTRNNGILHGDLGGFYQAKNMNTVLSYLSNNWSSNNAVRCTSFSVWSTIKISTVYSNCCPQNAIYYFAKADSHRGHRRARFTVYLHPTRSQGESYPSVHEAYTQCMKNALRDDFIFVGGSSYVVGDFLKIFN